ncbi:hypothetical protein SAMN05421538_106218 [Paracoccus isoporae]|uniref:Uncharacterized protein n=1 Tax=Paracoccus isoporae TaxID=591205 RepID=A0A1G7CV66_9RHOB|nr:hypothetical protein [Paracoccus isoporae]SDE43123.1 hypothetical protein SAMN05421538_106218 [Paracoccus isoporae]
MKPSDHLINAVRQIDRAIRVRGLRHTLGLALRVIATEGPSGIRRRLEALGPALRSAKPRGPGAALILTVPHTLHFARRLQSVLQQAGIEAALSDNDRIASDYDTVFTFALQNFPSVPADRCIAFQVEQSVLPHRWTEAYLTRLASCRAVFEYSQTNIAALQDRLPLARLFHVPLAPPSGIAAIDKPASPTVLFYGDTTPPRRAALLSRIAAEIPELQIETNLFGPRMEARLSQAHVVLNLHATQGGLLEVARISEAIAHGCVVVSETAIDQQEHPDLSARVIYAPEGDGDALIAALRALLDDAALLLRSQTALTEAAPDRFRLGVLRGLQGLGIIAPATFARLATDYPKPYDPSHDGLLRTCLTLPETPDRTASFLTHNAGDYLIWPGLKAAPGWRGAALSYRHMMRAFRAAGIVEALVVEDDVLLPADFEARLTTIRGYMDDCDADLFSGLIVDLHREARVLGVERRDGLCLVQLDRAVMMICNLYRRRMIEHLAQWDDGDDNAFSNTIDRYMERATHLRVVTTLPFTASYGASLKSTLRDADNHKFDALLARSEKMLAEKVAAFEAGRAT